MNFCFGTETELALVVESNGMVRPAPSELASAVIDDIANRYVHVPSPPPQHRLFLTNGSCIYADIGGHPEIATAECSNPLDLAAQTIALRRMLAESVETIGRVYGINVRLIANNVDYAFGGAQTYGYHLNMLVTGVTREQAIGQLAPLLVAMPIIAGTGKVSFNTDSPGFELSQRAQYMSMVTGKHTTGNRAMITAKDETLCKNGTRLHIICFDTPKSIYQIALVPAIIALVLKVVESGKDVAIPVTLIDPIQSLHTVSCDLPLRAKLPLKNDNVTTALDIHKHYIVVVGEFLNHTETPQWTKQMFELWQEIVNNLCKDQFLEIHRLDWVTKLVIFTKLLEQAGLTWKEYSRWIYVLGSVRRLKATWPTLDPLRLTKTNGGRVEIGRSALTVLDQYLIKHNLSWKDFPRIWNAANQLCQQCLRYHTLNLETDPKIAHMQSKTSLITEQMINNARTKAPEGTRATVRGSAITNAKPGATAGWAFLQQDGRRLVMEDAFGKDVLWEEQKRGVTKENR
jgi:hypothetical protein